MMKITKDDIIIYPTDTVWGIGCSIESEVGYKKIAEIKKTDSKKPLSILYTNISQLMKDFSLPDFMTEDWLREFFSLETTLGISVSLARRKFKKIVYQDSNYISVRFLESKNLIEIESPIFTTSLNITGQTAIINEEEAKSFREKYAKNAIFLSSQENLSGQPSTIVFLSDGNKFKIVRRGRFSDVLEQFISKNHLFK